MATSVTPSPTSEMVMPAQRTRKPRSRNGARIFIGDASSSAELALLVRRPPEQGPDIVRGGRRVCRPQPRLRLVEVVQGDPERSESSARLARRKLRQSGLVLARRVDRVTAPQQGK